MHAPLLASDCYPPTVTRRRLGIDEAGRGCVLGPMIFGACLVEEAREMDLRTLGARDSKKLSPARRVALRGVLEDEVLAWRTVSFAPSDMETTSLNELGKRAAVSLCLELRPDVLVIDAPVAPAGIPSYISDLRRRLDEGGATEVEIVAENGADDTHPCCSAASIFAKTTRDTTLAALEEQAGEALGSGYPGDARTVDYLRRTWARHRQFPAFVRTRWSTVRNIVAAERQGHLF